MRDDFSSKTIETLAKRVGCRCSNPGCRQLTIGPHAELTKTVNIGVAAHITAAAPGGKRYDVSLSSEQRKSIENGMWLCQNCGKLIDSDEQKYSVDLLMSWKREAERQASSEIENSMSPVSKDISLGFEQYLQNLIDRPQIWWLDEINDSTWHEFELFTKVQEKAEQTGARKPQELSKPLLSAIHDGENRSILITGAPGAGKSTFLEKLALEAARKAQEESNAPIPVLMRLKDYESSGEQPGIRGLIQSALESYAPSLDSEATQQLLQGKGRTLLLLIDGWNELSDEKAKSKIKTFCQPHSVIVTSRNAGDYSEIQQKFEIQPLSHSDVEGFFEKRLPNIERKRLQELVDRVQDFGQTPLMVWMLFSIFRNDDPIPKTRGEAYRAFAAIYAKRAKAGVDLSDARKLLGKLAFEMMRSPNPKDPTEFRSKVSEVEAGEILGSEAELDRMLNHLLNHQGREGIREISFCHQSLQEYYAAEHLRLELVQHPEWREKQAGEEYSWLQHHYLNYTKWKEPIALMLGLCEENTAVPIVEQALGVDLMLGARLAGEVRSDFQVLTTELLSIPELKNCLKSKLLVNAYLSGMSKQTVISRQEDWLDPIENHLGSYERMMLNEPHSYIRAVITPHSDDIDHQFELLVQFIEHWNWDVRTSAGAELFKLDAKIAIKKSLELLNSPRMCIRHSSAFSICMYGKKEGVPVLLETFQKLNYKDDFIDYEWSSSIEDAWITESCYGVWLNDARCAETAYALGQAKSEEALPELFRAINCSDNDDIVQAAVEALGEIPSEESLAELFKIIESSKRKYCRVVAVRSLSEISSQDVPVVLAWVESILRLLLKVIEDPDESVREASSEALGRFKNDRAAYLLPSLRKLLSTEYVKEALNAIQGIQANCKFYNYEIFHSPPAKPQPTQPSPPPVIYNINQVGNLNTGTVNIQGHQVGKSPPA